MSKNIIEASRQALSDSFNFRLASLSNWSKVDNKEFSNAQMLMPHCTPLLKESYYYRKIFENFFPDSEKLIPHFWMPKWSNATDPSARELKNYKE